jgi:TPR repeat protein
MKISCYVVLLILSLSLCPAKSQAAPFFNPENYPGVWTFVTNSDSTITARESAVRRQGQEAYSRVLQLKAVPVEIPAPNSDAPAEADIRQFIKNYRPPPIPYTSERSAKDSGREKFTCVEFADDLVKKANANGLPAQIIGIKFEGKFFGHAIAGFPTAEGETLYFDSTPGAGQISHEAHEAQVKVGQPYSRTGGGELAGVGKLPITEIIPVTKLTEFAGNVVDVPSDKTALVVENEQRVQAYGIEYADNNTLVIADDQLAKWNAAADEFSARKNDQQDAQTCALQRAAAKTTARALAENEQLAAQNDPYGQLRMGERYWTGDGVKKNPALARAYLKQAADQDSPTAILELQKINGEQP